MSVKRVLARNNCLFYPQKMPQWKNGINVWSVERPSVTDVNLLSMNGPTPGRNHIYAWCVEKNSVRRVTLPDINEPTLGRNRIRVFTAEGSSVEVQTLSNM